MEHPTIGQQPPTGPPDEPANRKCGDCFDSGFVSRDRKTKFGVSRVAWFCDCERGRVKEIYHWFNLCFPRSRPYDVSDMNRRRDDAGENELREYLSANPLQRRWLPDAIEARRRRHEDERKRKTEPLDGGSGE